MSEEKKKKRSWDTLKVTNNEDGLDWKTLVKIFKIEPNEWLAIRFLTLPVQYVTHWIPTVKKDGSKTAYPVNCYGYNSLEDIQQEDCVHCHTEDVRSQNRNVANVIVRKMQEEKPEGVKKEKPNAKGFKEVTDSAWSPVRVIDVPNTVISNVKEMNLLNKRKNKEGKLVTYSCDHPKFGFDILIKYDPKAEGTEKWKAQRDEKCPLTEEELAYLLYDVENIIPNYCNSKEEGDLFYEDKQRVIKDSKKKKKNSEPKEDFEDEDEVHSISPKSKRMVDADEEEETPKKKKRPVSEDDFEEEEAPKKKKKPAPVEEDDFEEEPPKKKKKPVEEDFETDIDEEEIKPKKKKPAPVEEEEDFEEEPPKKKKKPVEDDEEETPKSKKKSNEDSDDDWG